MVPLRPLSHGTGRDYIIIVEVSLGTELFKSFGLYSGDSFEMANCSVVHLGRKTTQSLLRSPRTEVFESVELYLEDVFGMEGSSVVTLRENSVQLLFSFSRVILSIWF